MPNLRSLSFTGTWGGRLDFGVFPKLDSFSVVECPKDDGGLDTLFAGHRREPVAACRSSLDRFLTFGRVKDLDLEPLPQIPNLRLFLTGHYRWNRDLSELPYMHHLAADHPVRRAYYSLKLG